jgi:hypothetical protein
MTLTRRILIVVGAILLGLVILLSPYVSIAILVQQTRTLNAVKDQQGKLKETVALIEAQQLTITADLTRLITCLYDRIDYDTGHKTTLDPTCAADVAIPPPVPPTTTTTTPSGNALPVPGAPGGTGAQGGTGIQGGTGAQGSTGGRGATGGTGGTGATGSQGTQGPTGPAGAGVAGPTGPPGPAGARGAIGPPGASIVGPAGPIGPAGATGATGTAGPPGPPPFPFTFTFTAQGNKHFFCTVASPTRGDCVQV